MEKSRETILTFKARVTFTFDLVTAKYSTMIPIIYGKNKQKMSWMKVLHTTLKKA
jgi:hypothetical protein